MKLLNKAFMSFRIGTPQWINEERFMGLMDMFAVYPEVTDEVTFFTSETHAPLTLKEVFRRCEILKDRMTHVREYGYRTGINILATMGHHEENLSNSLFGDYYNSTDIKGNVCRGSFCPNDKRFLNEYVKPVYEAMSNAEPDFIWVDDDVRLGTHMPISHVCFCDNCLEIFVKKFGKHYTRESLHALFNTGGKIEKLTLRKQWLQHNRNTITNLLRFIEQVVHSINPAIHLGFMDGSRFYEGFDLNTWAEALAGVDDVEVYWRPGGGAYTEQDLDAFIKKSHAMGIDAAVLPEKVRSIQSEIECFPYERLAKSTQAVAFEAAIYIAAGCTGAAYNVLSMTDEPLDDYYPLIEKLCSTRPFFDRLVSNFGRTGLSGIFNGFNKDSYAGKNLSAGDWLHGGGNSNIDEIFHIGLPVSYQADKAQVLALSGEIVEVLEEELILDYLSRGVYMDGETLERLNNKGYREYTGFTIGEKRQSDTLERLISHPLNDGFAGRYRDCRQSFWKGTAYGLIPNEGVESLSELVDYNGDVVADCGMGIFKNSLGGRICVAGYYPWFKLQFRYKTTQLKKTDEMAFR
jgi:hypothetical protein